LSVRTLTTRELNRALLARQHLLERTHLTPAAMIEHLVAMQCQTPAAPYYGLWSRIEEFDPNAASRLLEQREVVRGSLMRATLHLATRRDFLTLWPLTESVITRAHAASPFAKTTAGVDRAKLLRRGRKLLEEEPLTPAELGRRLAPEFPGAPADHLAYTCRYLLPLVQIPPRGLWGRGGQAKLTTVEAWLGEPPREPDVQEVIRRYLTAFGPATPADFSAWSGLTGAAEQFAKLDLVTYEGEDGRTLYDVPGAPLPDPDTPAPIRLLPQYDNALLAHADRTRIIPAEHHSTGIVGEWTILVDGFVGATWSPKTMTAAPLTPLRASDERLVARELKALARIHAR
jgi:hypothetical protein